MKIDTINIINREEGYINDVKCLTIKYLINEYKNIIQTFDPGYIYNIYFNKYVLTQQVTIYYIKNIHFINYKFAIYNILL